MNMHGKKFQPIEYKVLVKPDLVEETDDTIRRFKALGMELPEAEKQRDKMRQITGTLISVGGKAFEDFGDPSPKVGDKVYFAKYAGIVLESDENEEYRLMSDKDITAVLV
jgi:co-chaperonin GroES (HSP10)